MINLKSLLKESGHAKEMPSPALKDWLLANRVESLSQWVYHGTPYDGLKSMMTEGVWGTEHGEVAEYDAFSTSPNSEVISMFSDGDGETGLQFKVKDAKVIVLDEILTYLVTQLPGSGISAEIEDEEAFAKFCEMFKIPTGNWKHTPYLPYGYLSSLGVDAFVYDYTWKYLNRFGGNRGAAGSRDEHEICFIGNGIQKLNGWIETIYVDGEEFNVEEKEMALRAIAEKI